MIKRKIKVVIIDNEIRAINRLKLLLENFSQVEIVGQYQCGQEGLDFIKRKQPVPYVFLLCPFLKQA